MNLPESGTLTKKEYLQFLETTFNLFKRYPHFLNDSEGIESLELAHLIPSVPETVLSIYIGINDAMCNKGLITPFLPRHAHNNVFVFDPDIYLGNNDIPTGTIDAKIFINGFSPPNISWDKNWTYVMISDPARSFESLWKEKGYIDMIPAKFEDFTMLSDTKKSKVCFFIDPEAFNHKVNKNRAYLQKAREKGEKLVSDFVVPKQLSGETKNLIPVILEQGEKLYVARPDFQPCDHCWSNIHPDNKELAVVNENSAVPLDLILKKPQAGKKYSGKLIPPAGSADNTTDWFYRSKMIFRAPIKSGHING